MTYHLKRLQVLTSRMSLQKARKKLDSLQSLISSLESEEKRYLDAAHAEAKKAHLAIASGDAAAAEIAASGEREHLNRASSFGSTLHLEEPRNEETLFYLDWLNSFFPQRPYSRPPR